MSKRIWAAQRRPQSNSSRKYVLLFVALLRVWNMMARQAQHQHHIRSSIQKISQLRSRSVPIFIASGLQWHKAPLTSLVTDRLHHWTAPIDTSVQPRFCALQQCYNLVVAPASCIVQRSVAWVLGPRPMWRCFRHHTQCLAGISRAILKKVLIIIIVIYMILV